MTLMKRLLTDIGAIFLMSPLALGGTPEKSCPLVMETLNPLGVGEKVLSILDDEGGIHQVKDINAVANLVQLNSGEWYSTKYIGVPVDEKAGIHVGNSVIAVADDSGDESEKAVVKRIAVVGDNILFYLSPGGWYADKYVGVREKEVDQIHAGTAYSIIEDKGNPLVKVTEVARLADGHGLARLENGEWINTSYLDVPVSSLNGLSVGDRVMETISHSYQIVQLIGAKGHFRLSDGHWYHQSFIKK